MLQQIVYGDFMEVVRLPYGWGESSVLFFGEYYKIYRGHWAAIGLR